MQFKNKIVVIDSAPLIYFVEENKKFYPQVFKFFQSRLELDFQIITSVLSLTEVLVYPIRENEVLDGALE